MLTQNPSTFLHFPSPFFLDYDDDWVHNNGAFPWDDPIFMQEDDLQIFTPRGSVIDPREGEIEPIESLLADKDSTLRKKRHGKKDRHSKIYTARGPRDRRMRLSLEVARRFFDLQDMLGFDKASKTIEWLFSKSKGPIRELAEKASSCSFPAMIYTSSSSSEMRRLDRKATWLDLDPVVKRELRHKARERARERTKEKLKMRLLFSGNHNKEETIPTSNNLVSDQYQDDQNSCPADSTFVPGKYSSDICAAEAEAEAAAAMSTNPNLFIDSVLPMNQLMIGHDQETQYFSFLITNYLSTSIFGSI